MLHVKIYFLMSREKYCLLCGKYVYLWFVQRWDVVIKDVDPIKGPMSVHLVTEIVELIAKYLIQCTQNIILIYNKFRNQYGLTQAS